MREESLLRIARKISWRPLRKVILQKLFRRHKLHLQELFSFQNDRFFIFKVNDRYIPNESLVAVSYETQLEKCRNESLAFYQPAAGDVIVDAGAGLGEETLCYSSLTGPNGKVYAIEANPAVFNILEKTIALNELSNVKSFNLAIYTENSPVQMDEEDPSYEAGYIKNTPGPRGIPGMTMANFMISNNITTIDLLKANIEGAERFLVDTITSGQYLNIRHVAIACHDFRFRKEGNSFFKTKEHVIGVLEKNGFIVQTRNTGIEYLDDWVYGSNNI